MGISINSLEALAQQPKESFIQLSPKIDELLAEKGISLKKIR